MACHAGDKQLAKGSSKKQLEGATRAAKLIQACTPLTANTPNQLAPRHMHMQQLQQTALGWCSTATKQPANTSRMVTCHLPTVCLQQAAKDFCSPAA